jgi:peptidyl-dipeptidase A
MNAGRLSILLVLFCLLLISCQEKRTSPEQVLSALDSLEQKLQWLDHRIALEEWTLKATGRSDSLKFYQSLGQHILTDSEAAKVLSSGASLLDDEVALRRLALINRAMLMARVEAAPAVAGLRDSLITQYHRFRYRVEGSQIDARTVRKMVQTESDRSRREAAYRAEHTRGADLADDLARLFRGRNREAKRVGFNNFFALSCNAHDINVGRHLAVVRRLDSLSRAPYAALLDRIRESLKREEIEPWDVEYAFADVYADLGVSFPADSQLSRVKRGMAGLGFNLEKLPIFFDRGSARGLDRGAELFGSRPPQEIRILTDLADGLESTHELMFEVGGAIHLSQITQDRPLFIHRMDAAWSAGMSQMFAQLLTRPEALMKYSSAAPALAERYGRAQREIGLIHLRRQLLQVMFEYQIYQNPDRDLNVLYWELFEQYLLLPTHPELKSWPSLFELTAHPIGLQQQLIADMISAQAVASLQVSYPDLPDDRLAGSFLVQNYFRFGSRYLWRDLLKRGTDEDLDFEYLLADLGI